MPIPWLQTDPAPTKTMRRNGWAPRPEGGAKLVSGWQPHHLGAGQDDEEQPQPSVDEMLGRVGSWTEPKPADTSAPYAPTDVPPTDTPKEPGPTEPPPLDVGKTLQPKDFPAIQTQPLETSTLLGPITPAPAPAVRAPGSTGGGDAAARGGTPSGTPPQGTTPTLRVGNPTADQQSFMDKFGTMAMKVSRETGIPYQVLLAINANETGWGTQQAGNNYYGIKGHNPRTGATTGPVGTFEDTPQGRVNINDSFRAYDDATGEESMRDFAQLVSTSPTYAGAMKYLHANPNDWQGFIRQLKLSGYATGRGWDDQVIRIGSEFSSPDSHPASKNAYASQHSGQGGNSVIDVAKTAMGSKYVWGGPGGRSSFDPKFVGSDCSGFVAWAYENATGVRLPAQTASIWAATQQIDQQEAQPGDLIEFGHGQGPENEHVAIYMGNGQMIHDSSVNPSGGVDITPVWSGGVYRRVPGVDPSRMNGQVADAGGGYNVPSQPGQATAAKKTPRSWYAYAQGGKSIIRIDYTDGSVGYQDDGETDKADGAITNPGWHAFDKKTGKPYGAGQDADPYHPHAGAASASRPESTPSLGDLIQPDIGKPYKMGKGRENDMSADPGDHEAYDCSAFVSSVAARQGYKLTPFTDAMYDETQPVNPGEETAGDLIFYQYNDPEQRGVKYPHVGFYMGDGKTYEARWDKATGGQVGQYDQLDPKTFKPVFRRLAKPDVGAGQDTGTTPEGEADWSFLDTRLNPSDEMAYQRWKQYFAPQDSGADYDLRGAFLEGITPDTKTGHWPDTYKKPNHPTFSDQSKFAKRYPERAGSWQGDKFVPKVGAGQDEEDPRLAMVRQQELHERGDSAQPLPGDAPAPSVTDYHIPTAADVRNAAPAPAEPAPVTSGADLATQYGTALAEASAAPPVTEETPQKAVGAAPSQTLDIGGMARSAAVSAGGAVKDKAGEAAAAVSRLPGAAADAGGAAAQEVSQRIQHPQPQQRDIQLGQKTKLAQDIQDVAEATPGAAGEAASATGTFVRQSLTPQDTGVLKPAPTGDYDPSHIAPAAPAAPGRGVEKETPPTDIGQNIQESPALQDPRPIWERPDYDVGPRVLQQQAQGNSLPARAARGEHLDSTEQLILGTQLLQGAQDTRDEIIRAQLPEDVRDTDGGKFLAQGLGAAVDPTTYLGNAALDKGGTWMLRAGSRIAGAAKDFAGEAAVRAVGKTFARDAVAGLDAKVLQNTGKALANPITRDTQADVLKRTAFELNDKGLEDTAKMLAPDWQRGVQQALGQAGKHEPLTGDQLRTVVEAAAQARNGGDRSAARVLADKVFKEAGLEHLTSDYINGFSLRAAAAKQAGGAFTDYAMRLGGMGAGAITGEQYAEATTAPDDPHRDDHIHAGALGGAALGLGLPFAAGLLVKETSPYWRDVVAAELAPVKRMPPEAQGIWTEWIGSRSLAANRGRSLERYLNDVFARQKIDTYAAMKQYEETGQIDGYMHIPEVAQAVRTLDDIGEAMYKLHDRIGDARDLPLISGRPTTAKRFVPHVRQDILDQLRSNARKGKGQRGQGAMIPSLLSQYTEARKFGTLSEGERAGVQYAGFEPPGTTKLKQGAFSSLFGDYYSHMLQVKGDEQFIQNLMQLPQASGMFAEDIVEQMGKNPLEMLIPKSGLAKAPKLEPGWVDGVRFAEMSRSLQDKWIHPDLARALSAVSSPGSTLGKLISPVSEFGDFAKENMLGASGFHLASEIRQMGAADGVNGFKNMPRMIQQMFSRGTAARFWETNKKDMALAYKDGLTLSTTPWPEQVRRSTSIEEVMKRTGLTAAEVGSATYTASRANGDDHETALKKAMLWGGLGALGLHVPTPLTKNYYGKNTGALEFLQEGLFNRAIPFAKFTTYQLQKAGLVKRGVDERVAGRAAAEFANQVYGGQNILAIGRSREMQDIMRMTMLAPDWQEGWVRQVGSGLGIGNKYTAEMNRRYWAQAAVLGFGTLSALNLGIGHKWPWQNDPGHELTVDATPLYDLFGWDHHSNTGEPQKVYWDVLGPYRGMLEPFLETGRAAADLALQAPALAPYRQNLPDGVRGRIEGDYHQGIEQPDPLLAWGKFISARTSLVPGTLGDVAGSAHDFTGRPVYKASDDWYTKVQTGIGRSLARLSPVGLTGVIQQTEGGQPIPVALAGAVTGMRVSHDSASAQRGKMLSELDRQLGKSQETAFQEQQTSRQKNQDISRRVSEITGDGTKTPAEREKQIANALNQRDRRAAQQEAELPPDVRDDPELKKKFLDEYRDLNKDGGYQGSEAPANMPKDVAIDDLWPGIWDHNPAAIEGAGSDDARTQLREKWLTDAAFEHNIDPYTLTDAAKAKLQGTTLKGLVKQDGSDVKSSELDDAMYAYIDATNQYDTSDAANRGAAGKAAVDEYAKQWGVDPNTLMGRIRLRLSPLQEMTPAVQDQNKAYAIRDAAYDPLAHPVYLDQETGKPLDGSGPEQWKQWDARLSATSATYDKHKGQFVDPDLQRLADAKAAGVAAQKKSIYNSSGYDSWNHWYGAGKNMTDDQWAQYKAGTLDMYGDHPDPEEEKRRNKILEMSDTMTAKQLKTPDANGDMREATFVNPDGEEVTGPAWRVVAEIKKMRDPKWKDVSGVDPSVPPGVDTSDIAG